MELKELVILALKLSISCTVLGFGLNGRIADLFYLLKRPGLLARSLVSVYVVMPFIAVVLTLAFDIRPTLRVVLVALAISPVPPLLPKKETGAGGDHGYALGLMFVLSLLAIVVAPMELEILEKIYSIPLGIAPGAIAKIVLATVLAPLGIGLALRAAAPRVADRIGKPVDWIAKILLPLAVLTLLAGSWRALLDALGDATVPAMAAFVIAGLAVGHWLGQPRPDHAVVLALSTASRHPAIALSIGIANFPDGDFAGTALLYLLVCAIACLPYLAWHRRAHHPAATH